MTKEDYIKKIKEVRNRVDMYANINSSDGSYNVELREAIEEFESLKTQWNKDGFIITESDFL